MDLAVQCRSPMGKYLIELDKLEGDPDTLFRRELRNRLQSASSTRASTYRDINSDLSVHPKYQPNHYICELHRIATRLRLSSHRLRIETGLCGLAYQEKKDCVHVMKMSRPNPMYCSSALKLHFCDWNITILTLIA